MWSLLFDIALKANFYAKFEIKDCDLYFLLFIRNRQCANQTNFLFPIFQQVPSSSIAKGENKWCTWKRMDPCLCIMSARIRMKHVWTWQDLSKGFSSQVGTLLCVGTAVVIPVPAPALRGPHLCCRGGSQSSWTATVYNQTSSSGTLLVSPTLQCHQRHSPFFRVRSAAHEYPPHASSRHSYSSYTRWLSDAGWPTCEKQHEELCRN